MKILKLGDKIYAQSIQHFSASYLTGFPQRENFLFEHARDIEFVFFAHKTITGIEDVVNERERFQRFLKLQEVDYILVDNPFSGLLLTFDDGLPEVIFDCIDWYDEMYLKEFGLDDRYYLLHYSLLHLIKHADRVITQSPVMMDALLTWGLKTEKRTVISNGYDPKVFYPYSSQCKAAIKKQLSDKYQVDLDAKTVVVYTGKLGAWYKDINIIAEAIDEDMIFLIVGDGPIAHQINYRKNVIRCGAVPYQKVAEFTNIADVLVFPVHRDCSPIAISEYLAVGKPIVMARGRMEWLLKDGRSGVMVDNSVNGWREGIREAAKLIPASRYNLNLAKNLSWPKLAADFVAFVGESRGHQNVISYTDLRIKAKD